MRGGAPPDLLLAGAIVTTDPVVGANVTVALVGAPGASRRLRLWLVTYAWRRSANAVGELIFIDSSSSPVGGYGALSPERRAGSINYPGGAPTSAANRGLSVQAQASVASQAMLVAVFYTVEDV